MLPLILAEARVRACRTPCIPSRSCSSPCSPPVSPLRLWLLGRQIRAVGAGREQVPAAFANAITALQHAKAADYTIALAKFSRLHALFDAGLLLAFTIGGGIARIDAAISATGLPAARARCRRHRRRRARCSRCSTCPSTSGGRSGSRRGFGFNRSTPALFAAGSPQGPRDRRRPAGPAGRAAALAVRARGRAPGGSGPGRPGRRSRCCSAGPGRA